LIGFPDTTKFNYTEKLTFNIQNNVLERLINLSNQSIVNNTPEVILNRTNKEKPFFDVKIKRNEEAIQRIKNVTAQKLPLVDNFIFIFLDTLSRPQFKRKMKKVYSWIEKYYNNKTSPLESYQFMKYNAMEPNTQKTVPTMLTGVQTVFNNDTRDMIHKKFMDQGFVSAYASDMCDAYGFTVDPSLTWLFKNHNYDHELYSLFCDPTFTLHGKEYGLFHGPYSCLRRCIYGKDTFEYVLNYGDEFWREYKDEKKFLFMSFIDGHEFTNEVITYLDIQLFDWLVRHEENLEKNNTAIVFISDHGLHMSGYGDLFKLDDIIKELTLPSLFILLPRNLADKYGDDVKSYENKLVTAFDIHDFMESVSGVEQFSLYGKTLMKRTEEKRNCDKDPWIKEKWCRCDINN